MIFTPCRSVGSSATVPSTFPPAIAAKSKITLPGFMLAICASVTSRGAGLPGISAVVMTISCLAMCVDTKSACANLYSSDISVA